ncbi:DUF2867 domain-containing protein [Microbacterium sp. CFBP9034]|uniref:DUF2867 domain-containing protein n=1 Tax=Microbacterium sp. CFBP9034 TaxID=3096540 RepID=UPI002A6B3679|nr:DUF2867 domain-containing protein [Microbacterium sp. CFBP9034]MDY0909432.1 DUF2867 domain-containing protein [Microbacterium sp. CFBP9034]
MTPPTFRSLAFEDVGRFDYGDVILASKPPRTTDDPRIWAETLFSPRTAPLWVKAAMGVRIALAPLLGLEGAPKGVFDVRRVEGDEALIEYVDAHLTFRCGVGVDAEAAVVRVTTVVTFNDWRGRVYFTPVSLAHPLVVHSMLRRARRVLAARG